MINYDDTVPDFENKENNDYIRKSKDNYRELNQGMGLETQAFLKLRNGFEEDVNNFKTVIIDKSKSTAISNAWMVVVKGKNAGREYSIPPQGKPERRRVAIGRESINDIIIDDPAISSEHAFIICENNTYAIGDAGSLNGTILNGKKVTSFKKLKDGDNLIFGETELIFKCITILPKPKQKNNAKGKKSKSLKKKTNVKNAESLLQAKKTKR